MRLYTNEVAKVCHAVNGALREFHGEDARPVWDETSALVQEGVMSGIEKLNANPHLTPEDMHSAWCMYYGARGWKYGKTLSDTKKTHPNLVAYDKLPAEQKLQDVVFHAIVKSLR